MSEVGVAKREHLQDTRYQVMRVIVVHGMVVEGVVWGGGALV